MSTPFFLGEGQHFKSWSAGCAGKCKSDPVALPGFIAHLYCLHTSMQSARKLPDHTCRAKFLWVSCAQVGDVQGQACHRPVHLQILRFQLFLTMVWMLWMHLGYCQQCCLQDSVCSLCLNQLPNHCTGIVQSIRSVAKCQVALQVKLLSHNQTTVLRKNIQQFWEVRFVLYLCIFFSVLCLR